VEIIGWKYIKVHKANKKEECPHLFRFLFLIKLERVLTPSRTRNLADLERFPGIQKLLNREE